MNEITVDKAKLVRHIEVAGAAFLPGTKNKTPSVVLLKASENDVSILAGDSQIFIEAGKVNDEEHIEAFVNYKALLEAVKSLNDIITIQKMGNNLILKSGKNMFSIKSMEWEIATEPPSSGEIVGSFYVNTKLWNDAISRVSFAAAIKNPYRTVLSGIHVRVENDMATIEAVDGVNAARVHIPVWSSVLKDLGQRIDFVFPAITAKKIAKVVKPDNPGQDEMLVRVFSHRFDFDVGDVFISILLLDTDIKFPDLDRFFWSTFEREIIVHRKILSTALKQALLFSQKSGWGNITVLSNSEIVVEVSDNEDGSTTETIPAMSNIDIPYSIWFDFDRLNNIVKNVHGIKVKIECNKPTDPVRISGDNSDLFAAVLMPVNRQN